MACLSFFSVRAQDSDSPLIMLIDGDFWSWTEGSDQLRQLTEVGRIITAVLSPDGSQIACTVSAGEAPAEGEVVPTDICLFDLTTGQFTAITEPSADKTTIRSTPAWSPDGTRLAWTEVDQEGDTPSQLLIYNLNSAETQTALDDLQVNAPVDVMWGESGLVLAIHKAEPSQGIESFQVYSESGDLLNTLSMPPSIRQDKYIKNYLLVGYKGQEYLAAGASDGLWYLLDPRSDEKLFTASPPQATSRAAPGRSLLVSSSMGSGSPNRTFYIDSPQGKHVNLYVHGRATLPITASLALSPDGQSIAYFRTTPFNQAVKVWGHGDTRTLPAVDETFQQVAAVMWTPLAWRVPDNAPTRVEGKVFPCPGALPPRLTVDQQGCVIPGGGANNLRFAPNTDDRVIGKIPENACFTVLRGPACANNRIWWLVEYDGVTGWTAEGQDQTYYVEPAK